MRVLIVIGALAVAACEGGPSSPGSVSKASFEAAGKTWPLTVDSGTVGCTGSEYWFEHAGSRYALNGFANSNPGKYRPIEPLWAWDDVLLAKLRAAAPAEERDGILPVRISLGGLIEAADAACPDD